ncbi:MAG: glucose-6-phosphate dehydrogenase, partial [Opitutales bacterium]
MTDSARHPFLEGLSKHRGAPPTILVIFGASGDLTARKLIPALFNLGLDSLLPADFRLVGFSRTEIPDDNFRAEAKAAVEEHSRRPLDAELWESLEGKMSYHAGHYDDPAS